ncbi:hypothetical protein TYRP_013609 [Tyrophagus putrescentiae]|nr:hypothetical protein TYRP_013609 [Tyrophagus putrescentiae]
MAIIDGSSSSLVSAGTAGKLIGNCPCRLGLRVNLEKKRLDAIEDPMAVVTSAWRETRPTRTFEIYKWQPTTRI